jgi:bifunctional DNase/RNase
MAVEMVIHGVGQAPQSGEPLVLLKERDGERYVIITIGPLEIVAIATAAMNQKPPRPMTHDLLCAALEASGARVTRIVIHSIVDKAFHARIVLDVAGRHVELDSRSSDAIAVALRVSVPIHVEETVLAKAGFTPNAEGTAPGSNAGDPPAEKIREDQLGAFRDVIRGLNLDDLGKPPAS